MLSLRLNASGLARRSTILAALSLLTCGLVLSCSGREFRGGATGGSAGEEGHASGGVDGSGSAGSGGGTNGDTSSGGARPSAGGSSAAGGMGGDTSSAGGSGSGGSKPAAGGSDGGGGGAGPGNECPADFFDCNGESEDGCETKGSELTAPASVTLLRPVRTGYTGSLHAPARAKTLRPTFTWSDAKSGCGERVFEIQVDNGCSPGKLDSCAFDSPEIDAASDTPSFHPTEDLPVSRTAPVGSFYGWRVRACDIANCAPWSEVSGLHVGRTEQDINGDGYAEVLAHADDKAHVYLGASSFDRRVSFSTSLPDQSASPRFVGDLNGDGFAEIAMSGLDSKLTCNDPVQAVVWIRLGAADPDSTPWQPVCGARENPVGVIHARDVGDLDGDGYDELVVHSYLLGTDTVRVFAGGASLSLKKLTELSGADDEFLFQSKVPHGRGDFNGDGRLDFVVYGRNLLSFLYGKAELRGEFDENLKVPGVSALVSTPDMDDDSDDELAVVRFADEVSSFAVIAGGQTAEKATLKYTFESKDVLGMTTPSMDFDGDGVDEFILPGPSAMIWRPESDPSGTSSAILFSFIEESARAIDVADHNGDGLLDVIFSDSVGIRRAEGGNSLSSTPVNLESDSEYPILGY